MSRFEEDGEYKKTEESRTLLTIMGDNAVLDGKFKISQSIDIDCEVKGKLVIDGKITIQKDGFVSADVKTIDAEIIGTYEGNLEASGFVEVKETGVVSGNIKTDSFIINKGGIFSGNVVRMSEEEDKSKKKGKGYRFKKDFEKEGSETEEYISPVDEDMETAGESGEQETDNEEGLSL